MTPGFGFLRHKLLLSLGFAIALAGCSEVAESPNAENNTQTVVQAETRAPTPILAMGSGFDFYVLALSWSPTYCQSEGKAKGDRNQCGSDANFGFIVHGLWPQLESDHPAYCPTRQPDRVPARLGESLFDIVPSMGLIGHMWRKHGTCSGLSQADYFKVVRAARDRVQIPDSFRDMQKTKNFSTDEIENAFMTVNPDLKNDGIAAVCANGRLREIRICLTDDLRFRTCREVDRSGCQARSLTIPPVR